MPAYYFRLLEDAVLLEDEDGVCLPDADAAREVAITSARCIMADAIRRGLLDLKPSIEVYDGDGRRLFSLPFREALAVAGID